MIKKLFEKKTEKWLTWSQFKEAELLWEGINKLPLSIYSFGGLR